VNARGQAVGQSDVDGVAYRAVLWENGEMVDLLPGTTHSQAAAINEPGQIVVNDGSHAWLWQKGSMFELPELGLPDAYGYSGTAINSRGDIVGIFMLPGGKRHACLWQKTGPARQVGAPSIDAVINAVAAP
jgi:probable HAF family extracellular repeat protein